MQRMSGSALTLGDKPYGISTEIQGRRDEDGINSIKSRAEVFSRTRSIECRKKRSDSRQGRATIKL